MLTIRLTRKGKKNQPFFRVVVIDKRRSSTGGRSVEDLGYMNPLTKKKSFNKERILYWIKNGAQPSASIHNLLVEEKIIEAKKIAKKSRPAKSASAVAQSGGPVTIPPKADLVGKPEVAPEAKPEEKPEEKPAEQPPTA
jgi:small subunit ribosomal protein S16